MFKAFVFALILAPVLTFSTSAHASFKCDAATIATLKGPTVTERLIAAARLLERFQTLRDVFLSIMATDIDLPTNITETEGAILKGRMIQQKGDAQLVTKQLSDLEPCVQAVNEALEKMK